MTAAIEEIMGFMDAGGPIMYLLAIMSVVATTVFASKMVQFLMLRLWNGRERDEALRRLRTAPTLSSAARTAKHFSSSKRNVRQRV